MEMWIDDLRAELQSFDTFLAGLDQRLDMRSTLTYDCRKLKTEFCMQKIEINMTGKPQRRRLRRMGCRTPL